MTESIQSHILRMPDANADGADWREVSRIVLNIDPSGSPIGRVARYKRLLRRVWGRRRV